MKKALVLLLVAGAAHAETSYLTVPGEGWSMKFDAPAMTDVKGKMDSRSFGYLASSTQTGVTISIYTETDGSSDNETCRRIYWGKGLENPNLVKDSVKLFETNSAKYVTHRSEGVYRGTAFKTANGHAFFVKNGLCVDVHVSHWPYRDDSEAIVEKILRSVSIVE